MLNKCATHNMLPCPWKQATAATAPVHSELHRMHGYTYAPKKHIWCKYVFFSWHRWACCCCCCAQKPTGEVQKDPLWCLLPHKCCATLDNASERHRKLWCLFWREIFAIFRCLSDDDSICLLKWLITSLQKAFHWTVRIDACWQNLVNETLVISDISNNNIKD